MLSGTNINELTESLSTGQIIRLFGTGWRPRSTRLDIIDTANKTVIQIKEKCDIEQLMLMLTKFLNIEIKINKEN